MPDYLQRKYDFSDPGFASSLDEISWWSSHFGRLLLNRLELRRNIVALDLACGNGFPLLELAGMHGSSCRFYGMDIWKESLARAALKQQAKQIPNAWLIRADGIHLPFESNKFDLITSNLGLNNFENASAVLRECARVVRSGGRIVLTSNVKGHFAELYSAYREVLSAQGLENRMPNLQENEDHRGSKESISRMLEKAGFRVTSAVVEPFTLRYLNGSALLNHPLTVLGFLDGWRKVVEPADEERVLIALEERLNEMASKGGELRMTIPALYMEAERR